MRRAATASLLAILCVACAAVPGAARAAAAAAATPVNATIGGAAYGQPLGHGFVGFSFEYPALHEYTGRDPARLNPVLVALMRRLAAGGPGILRVGGNSADETWWPMRGVHRPAGITYGLTPGWARVARALARAVGTKLILGINLAAGRPAIAGAEATALVHGVGANRIAALEIGNEPDLYPVFPWYRDRRGRTALARRHGYSMTQLIDEENRWRAAMPDLPLAGPAFATVSWMNGLTQFLSAVPGIRQVTFHRYALRGCANDPADPSYASIANLMTDRASNAPAQLVAPFVQTAHARGLSFRLDELNSASCRGRSGTSNTFASALWLLDTLFQMAAVGVDAVNLHTLPGAPYEPFTFSHDRQGWHGSVRPLYYGALFFNRAFPPGGRLLPVAATPGPVKVWATRGPDGHTRVLVINKQDTVPATVTLSLPGTGPVRTQSLRGPGLAATSGVTLDGESFGRSTSSGRLSGAPDGTTLEPVAGALTLTVPQASALLLTR